MENITLVVNKRCQQPLQLMKLDRRPPSSPNQVTLQTKVLSAGLAACIADLLTFPLDTAKVRLQIQGELPMPTSGAAAATDQAVAKKLRYRGLVHTICTISRQEGPRALYNGLTPGLQRQMCFASVRIGLYDSVKQAYFNLFSAGANGNVGLRILAGATTGGMAVLCAQPTDVVKVRFQAQPKGSKRYSGVFNAYRTIGKEEGFKGLWKGSSANIARNAIVNATELVSYDLIKMKILASGLLTDNMPCHFLSAFGAGFCTTVMASPVDVVKTRFMNSGAGSYNGVLHCAITMYKNEGATAFYKGFWPSFMRLGSWNILMFVCFEQLKRGITQASETRQETRQSPLIQLPIEIKTGPSRYI